jgi:uncharacterized protein YukE
MSDGSMQYVYDSLGLGSTAITRGVDSMRETLGHIQKQCAPLEQDSAGQWKTSYVDCKTRWDHSAEKIASIMMQVASAVDGSAASMQDTDSAAAKLFPG